MNRFQRVPYSADARRGRSPARLLSGLFLAAATTVQGVANYENSAPLGTVADPARSANAVSTIRYPANAHEITSPVGCVRD